MLEGIRVLELGQVLSAPFAGAILGDLGAEVLKIERIEGGDDARLGAAVEALRDYLDAPVPGLWYENRAADGSFVIDAAPATSLYHIIGAVAEFWTAFGAKP